LPWSVHIDASSVLHHTIYQEIERKKIFNVKRPFLVSPESEIDQMGTQKFQERAANRYRTAGSGNVGFLVVQLF
jgi:hypothetical protein